jgi:hypothetical protein
MWRHYTNCRGVWQDNAHFWVAYFVYNNDYYLCIMIIIIIISFMQGIYTYIPETNNVPRECSVAAILLLLFMVPIYLVPVLALLCFYVSTFRSMCAVPNMAVFCSSLTSWFPGMLLTYYYYYYYYYCRLSNNFSCQFPRDLSTYNSVRRSTLINWLRILVPYILVGMPRAMNLTSLPKNILTRFVNLSRCES